MITTEQSCLISVKEITRIIQNEQTQRPRDAEWVQGCKMTTKKHKTSITRCKMVTKRCSKVYKVKSKGCKKSSNLFISHFFCEHSFPSSFALLLQVQAQMCSRKISSALNYRKLQSFITEVIPGMSQTSI